MLKAGLASLILAGTSVAQPCIHLMAQAESSKKEEFVEPPAPKPEPITIETPYFKADNYSVTLYCNVGQVSLTSERPMICGDYSYIVARFGRLATAFPKIDSDLCNPNIIPNISYQSLFTHPGGSLSEKRTISFNGLVAFLEDEGVTLEDIIRMKGQDEIRFIDDLVMPYDIDCCELTSDQMNLLINQVTPNHIKNPGRECLGYLGKGQPFSFINENSEVFVGSIVFDLPQAEVGSSDNRILRSRYRVSDSRSDLAGNLSDPIEPLGTEVNFRNAETVVHIDLKYLGKLPGSE